MTPDQGLLHRPRRRRAGRARGVDDRTATHDRLGTELRHLLDAVLPGEAIADRALSESLLQIIGIVVRLHEEHVPDRRGRCEACGRRPCPVQPVLAIHPAARSYPPGPPLQPRSPGAEFDRVATGPLPLGPEELEAAAHRFPESSARVPQHATGGGRHADPCHATLRTTW